MALVTAPDMDTARKIARAALEQRVAACANIVPQIESHYWWQGKIEQTAEILIVFKTLQSAEQDLRECVLANHPYNTPEFVTFAIDSGNERYFRWIQSETRRR